MGDREHKPVEQVYEDLQEQINEAVIAKPIETELDKRRFQSMVAALNNCLDALDVKDWKSFWMNVRRVNFDLRAFRNEMEGIKCEFDGKVWADE